RAFFDQVPGKAPNGNAPFEIQEKHVPELGAKKSGWRSDAVKTRSPRLKGFERINEPVLWRKSRADDVFP
ncbi:hypothetical protein, partial [Geobacillus stearothermophilus]|uniref:hypothetical protein n=1 Tax=Geobacillus stearothermophilus TaxID=1422 RepID=UPI001F318CB0